MSVSRSVWVLWLTSVGLALYALQLPAAEPAARYSSREVLEDGRLRDVGLVLPHGRDSVQIRNNDGDTVVRWTAATRVALKLDYEQLDNVLEGRIRFRVAASDETVELPLPAGRYSARKRLRKAEDQEWMFRKGWTSANRLAIYHGFLPPSLATPDDPALVGAWRFPKGRRAPGQLEVLGETLKIVSHRWGHTDVLLYGVISMNDCRPYVQEATVTGRFQQGEITADEIQLRPIGDCTFGDVPGLPRLMFLGDSISFSYAEALRQTLAGKVNCWHPPANCGSSRRVAEHIRRWLGAYELPGRRWDVVAMNFGHWDAATKKEDYQANMRFVIRQIEATGARLIWVTTCPVPEGYAEGSVGRRAGRMQLQNQWAAEVLVDYPDIRVCNQWQYVRDDPEGLYAEWWKGRDVNFHGAQADALGHLLAREVLAAIEAPRSR